MRELICKVCGAPRNLGRRLCKKCNNKRVNSRPRYKWTKLCEICGQSYEAWGTAQKLCISCYKDTRKTISKANNNYLYDTRGRCQHRNLAEEILGRKLTYNEVIHHVDENPKNNDLTNLMILSRSNHTKLHHFLGVQRVIWEKSQNEKDVNCWEAMRVMQTTAWLEITGAKVIKLHEFGNQQPSSLTGEGSETKDVQP